MVLPQAQSQSIPENIIISVIQRDVEFLTRNRSQEELITAKVEAALKQLKSHDEKNRRKDDSQYDPKYSSEAQKALDQYSQELGILLQKIEGLKKNGQLEQLKVLRKIGILVPIVDDILAKIQSLGKYPFQPGDTESIEKIKKAYKFVQDLPHMLRNNLELDFADVVRDELANSSLAHDQMPKKPASMFLVPERKFRERKAAEQRIYYLDEDGLKKHIEILLQRFDQAFTQLDENIKNEYTQRNGVPLSLPHIENHDLLQLDRQLLSDIARTLYALVHDVKNLIDFYQRHFRSTVYLDINLTIKEAELLKQLEKIIALLQQIDIALHPQLKLFLEQLNEKKDQFKVFASYDYEREQYIDRSVLQKYLGQKELGQRRVNTEKVQFKSGAQETIKNFKFTVRGARGFIRAQAFYKEDSRTRRKAVILVPGFTAYRQLVYNIAEFFAAEGYLGVVMDIASQGESRGKYGYAEGSENILILAKHLREKLGGGEERCFRRKRVRASGSLLSFVL